MKTALTIAGSDSSGGAGIQADIKTMSALGVYAESVVTALTAQNTMGVQGVVATDPDFVLLQMKSVFSDICPNAVKIGMLPTAEVVRAVGQGLQRFRCSECRARSGHGCHKRGLRFRRRLQCKRFSICLCGLPW